DLLKSVFGIERLDDAAFAKMREASPATYVTARTPPFLFIHGTADTLVPYAQSTLGVELLKKAGVSCDLITVPGGAHGVINWEKDPKQQAYKSQMVDWLRQRLR